MRILAALLLLTATAIGQDGLNTGIGTGLFPEGIVGVTDIKTVQLARVEVLKLTVEALQTRYQGGLDSIDNLLESQMELALAQLDTARWLGATAL